MSIIVKGMEMPKNCRECPVALSGKYCRINKTYTTYIKLPIRPNHCPLIALPNHHGRLGDLDALIIDLMNRGLEGVQTDDWAEIQQTVMEQPTIVESEDGT